MGDCSDFWAPCDRKEIDPRKGIRIEQETPRSLEGKPSVQVCKPLTSVSPLGGQEISYE